MAESAPQASSGLNYPPAKEGSPHHSHSHGGVPVGWLITCIIIAAIAVALAADAHKQGAMASSLRTQLDGANSQMVGVKADLDKANARSNELQTQLDQAKTQLTDLQGKLTASQHETADLQSQVQKAEADAHSQQDQSQAQTADLQAKLSQANDRATGLQHDLDQAKSQTADLQAQMAKAQTDAEHVTAAPVEQPELPVKAEFKKGFLSEKYTLHLTNTGGQTLKADIAISGSTAAPKSVTIEAGKTAEVGDLPDGAAIVISSEGFKPVNATVR